LFAAVRATADVTLIGGAAAELEEDAVVTAVDLAERERAA
jgi:hypothetical protein